MAVSNKVSTITQNFIMPKAVDQVLDANPGFVRFVKKSKKFPGAQVEVPVFYETKGTATSFSGYDNLPTTSTDNRINMTFDPKFVTDHVTLAKTEIAKNNTQEQVIDLIELETEWTTQSLADELGTQFYADGTGNGGEDINGMQELVDDGTNTANIGGLARATYTALKSTVTATGGTLALSDMRTMYDNARTGNRKPTVILTTETVASLYEQLLEPKVRFTDGSDKYKTGAGELMFKSIEVVPDEKCNSGEMYFVNEDFIECRTLDYPDGEPVKLSTNIEGNDYQGNAPKGLGFHWTGWVRSQSQEAIVGRIVWAGNFIQKAPRLHGVLTGITGV